MEMEQRKKSAKKWMIVSVGLLLLSMIGASIVQSSGGRVTIKDLRWETSLGRQMSALLFIPDSATGDNPAPAVVTSHGWYNTREMQDLNYVELARRGYVVMSIDMYGHGNSDPFSGTQWNEHGTGMYDAVELMAALPYVDKTKIGVTGHSNGARAVNLSIDDDNKAPKPLIAAALLVANDATYKNPANNTYWNKYGNRDVGIIAAQYDEFFFRRDMPDGTKSVPRTYIGSLDAQSFLNFGRDPAGSGIQNRVVGEYYAERIDGQEALRVIYQPFQIHPWNHFSKTVDTMYLTFWDKAFGAPNPIAPANQIWQVKVFFNLIGVVGFIMFMIMFAILLTFTPFFADLRSPQTVKPRQAPADTTGKLWFWIPLVVSIGFGMYTYFRCLAWAGSAGGSSTNVISHKPSFFWQVPPYGIGVWAFITGILCIVIMVVSYYAYGKKKGLDVKALGVKIDPPILGKTILLALLTVAATYAWVFISQYFFKTDYRFWVLAIKAFTPDKLLIALPYLPLFLVYYVANSVSVNCFNYNDIGRKEWVNTAILAISNGIGPLILVAIQYIHFRIYGELYFNAARGAAYALGSIGGIWLFPIIIFLPASAIISRKIYRVTGNPYLAGIINGIMVVLISCTNTLTMTP